MSNYINQVLASGRIGGIRRGEGENRRDSFILTIVGKSRVDHIRFVCPGGIPDDIENGMKVNVEGFLRSYIRDEKSVQGFVASKISQKKSEMNEAFAGIPAGEVKGYFYMPDYCVVRLSGHVAGKIDSSEKFGKIILHTANMQYPDFGTTVIFGYYKAVAHRPDFAKIKTGDKMFAICSVFTPEIKEGQDARGRYYEDLSVEDVYIEPIG